MNKITKTILALLACLILLSIVFYDNWKYRNRYETGEQTTGTIKVGIKNVSWTYQVNGIEYVGRISKGHYQYLLTGEKYTVHYDKDDPSSSSLSHNKPIIDSTEYQTVLSDPLNTVFDKGNHFVQFRYMVYGKTYERKQKHKFENSYSSKGKQHKVYYNIENPQMSYIEILK